MAGLEVLLLGAAALAPAHAVPGADSAAARAAALPQSCTAVRTRPDNLAEASTRGGTRASSEPL